MMDKIRRYIECYIETETCNLRCHYCYITQLRKFNNKPVNFEYSLDTIRRALSKSRLGGVCLLNFCAGGETLLQYEVVAIMKELLSEGHYVMVVTHGLLTERLNAIAEFPPELLERLMFKFSFHYLELIRVNKIEVFFANVNKMKKAGCSFTVEITPTDELVPHIPDIKNICLDKLGVLCHVTVGRDDRTEGVDILSGYSFEEYKKTWGVFDSELFDFKMKIFYQKRNEFCYAGDWGFVVNINTGELRQCYRESILDNIYENTSKPLNFKRVGTKCRQPHCYNGHAFLTLGIIPALITPAYAEVRDRTAAGGDAWLKPRIKEFLSQKLYDNNKFFL